MRKKVQVVRNKRDKTAMVSLLKYKEVMEVPKEENIIMGYNKNYLNYKFYVLEYFLCQII